MSEENRDLYHLDELADYKVASDYPDVRDWVVLDAEHRTIGRVDSLLVSKKAERVVYLDVELNDSVISETDKDLDLSASEGAHAFLNSDGDRHLILPVGLVSLDEYNNAVIADELRYSALSRARRFNRRAIIASEDELCNYNYYSKDTTEIDTRTRSDDFYDRPEFTIGAGRGYS